MKWGNNRQNDTYWSEQETNEQNDTTNSISEQYPSDVVQHTTAQFVEQYDDDSKMTEEKIVGNKSQQPKSSTKKGKSEINSYLSKCRQFNGEIINVDTVNKTFIATLNSTDGILREASFFFDDVDEEDESLILPKAQIIFIYGKQYINGTAFNFSKIYFRSKFKWTSAQIKKANNDAEELLKLLKKKNEVSND